MTTKEFNQKWKKHLQAKYQGLEIDNPEVIEYLDCKFTELSKNYPNFEYTQIKIKSGNIRVYMYPYEINTFSIESKIGEIVKS